MSESIKIKKGLNYTIITIVLFWCGLIVMSSMYLTIPLISLFTSKLNISSNLSAWTTSIFCIFFAGGCLIYGPLSDRYGRKKIILMGMVLLTVITPMI